MNQKVDSLQQQLQMTLERQSYETVAEFLNALPEAAMTIPSSTSKQNDSFLLLEQELKKQEAQIPPQSNFQSTMPSSPSRIQPEKATLPSQHHTLPIPPSQQIANPQEQYEQLTRQLLEQQKAFENSSKLVAATHPHLKNMYDHTRPPQPMDFVSRTVVANPKKTNSTIRISQPAVHKPQSNALQGRN